MTNLLTLIVNAIIRQEGMALTYTNPGNLRGAPWSIPTPMHNGFWNPSTRQEGIAGIYHVVALRIAERATLRSLINAWAPATDGNQPTVYLNNVMQWTEITNPDQLLWELY